MLSQNNTYFEELRKLGYEFEEQRRAHEAKKEEIIEKYGWESDELKAWYEEKAAMKFPIESGAMKAHWAWVRSLEHGNEELEMNDFLWEKEVKDFVDALRKAGFKSFIYTNTSTAVMENLHQLAAEGCTMIGLCTIERMEDRWGKEEKVSIQGIRFEI